MEPILYDTHMHTPLCKHAVGHPKEYAAFAHWRGLKGIIITCHNPIPDGWASIVRMRMDQFDQYVAMVQYAADEWQGRLDVRLGMESDYVPGMEGWLEKLHTQADFHYILGSVHVALADYKKRFFHGDVREFQHTYFDHLAMAAETGLFDCLSHPDLVKIVFPKEWDPVLLLDPIRRALDRIARTGLSMELNTSGLIKRAYPEMSPGRLILEEMKQRDIPVTIGSDAHKPARVGAAFEQALDLLQEVGYTHTGFFINRRRHEVEIEQARHSLRK